jgi:cytochrome c oxidase subunit 3/cytochrome o ubiquinol oxidase subunit 3
MNAVAIPFDIEIPESRTLPSRGKVGMFCLIIAESAIFTIFVVAYLFYVGKSLSGPTPREVLEVPIFYSVCLLSSSLTIHFAGRSLSGDRRSAFLGWWLLTIVLGGLFMFGTWQEWHRLIYEHGLTIATNLFGTTYYSLVGLHAFHVTVGLIMLSLVLGFAVMGGVRSAHHSRIDVLSLYWHFVDGVWVVVFTVVYVIGR